MTLQLPALRRQALPLAFLLSAAALVTAQFLIRPWVGRIEESEILALGMALDLVVGLPALYYLLLVRPRRVPPLTLVPVALLSFLLASRILPQAHQGALDALRWLVVPLELGGLGWIAYQARRVVSEVRRGGETGDLDVPEALQVAAARILPAPAARILAYEASILYFALLAWRRRPPEDAPPRAFTVYRESGYIAVVLGLLIAVVVELVAIHVLLTRFWSPTAAWVASALSLYGLLWILGDLQALRHRRTRLGTHHLDLRVGLRWQAKIPNEDIESLRSLSFLEASKAERPPGLLEAVAAGSPRFELRLRRPVTAVGPYGFTKETTCLRISVDHGDLFARRLEELRPAPSEGDESA